MWFVFILVMAELLEEHTVNEELTPAVPSMSAEVDTRRVVDRRDVCFRCGKQEVTTGALKKGLH